MSNPTVLIWYKENFRAQFHFFITSIFYSLQQTADSKHETIAENEELKSTISKLQEKKKDLSTKITQIDKEKLSYENQCSDLQLKVKSYDNHDN